MTQFASLAVLLKISNMSNPKRGAASGSKDSDSDSDLSDTPSDIDWEPEEGGVFNVPYTEF